MIANGQIVEEVEAAAKTEVMYVEASMKCHALIVHIAEIIERGYITSDSMRYKIILGGVQSCG